MIKALIIAAALAGGHHHHRGQSAPWQNRTGGAAFVQIAAGPYVGEPWAERREPS